MAIGTVKWFNNAKGYGFIVPENGGDDLFVHYSSIEMEGYRTLKAGQEVSYDEQAGEKGSAAVRVRQMVGSASEGAEPLAAASG
jgi:CspA family cold shock protein